MIGKNEEPIFIFHCHISELRIIIRCLYKILTLGYDKALNPFVFSIKATMRASFTPSRRHRGNK